MAKGFIGATGYKAYLGATKMKAGYIGATRVYSAGSTVTYVVDNGVSYTEEVDSGASCLSPKSFTPTKSGWTFWGWRQDTSPNGNVLTSLVMEDHPITLYAVYAKSVTVSYYNESTGAIKDVKNRYYNSGSITNPTFTLHQAAKSGWTPAGWAVENGSVAYSNGTAFTRDSDITLYGKYNQAITVTYYNGTTSAASATGTRSYYSGTGTIVNPIFSLTPASLSGWTFRGWATSSVATAGIAYNSISNTAFGVNTTVYAAYSQTITLSYNGNGATSGSIAAQTGTRYWNTGNVSNPSFTLPANAFTRPGYTFSYWALNGGTAYSPGAVITLEGTAIMYAMWVSNAFYVIQNGALVEGRYTSQVRSALGHSTRQTNWGVGGHSNNNGDYSVAAVRFNSGQCTQLTVRYKIDNWGSQVRYPYLRITGVANKCIDSNLTGTHEETYTVMPNTQYEIKLDTENTGDYWYEITFLDIYLQ